MNKILNYLINLPVFANVDATINCKRMAWLFTIIAINGITGFSIPLLGSIYIPVCMVCLLYILACGKLKIDGLYVVMYIAFFLSALGATEPFFNSNIRYLLFLCVTLLCTSCISSPTAIAFRSLVYRNILILLTFLTIGSFVCYFLGINLVRKDLMHDVTSAGVFGGLYAHSMLLGPMSALVALMFLNTYVVYRKKILIALFFIAAAAVVMSASRGATLAMVVPIVYSLFFMKDLGGGRKALIGLLVVTSIVAIPIADRIATGLITKQQRNEKAGSTFDSREDKWDNRIREFEENPVLGIGFCSVDLRNSEDYNAAGGVESGSTHLSILSMTGVVGMIPYLCVLLSAYKSVRRDRSVVAQMRMYMFLAMITHAMFEGYALYAGGFLCFVYWLMIGHCADYKKMKNRLE
ncbi:O-antigen ligase [Bacteroides faecium]|jgi:ABC-type multidrug transport system fused ATPase/permease subunit|uniref:O-antigen ligase family protein n=1 Tax=Bacteroides faecium TaxID=2715212 RepID=A0A6H0KUW7_9BACE|nr:O-antigen ligase family protein [Bacteroides faecium]QIU96278.1 O-antigen ligase family protein [Bacteroides faecium]CDA86848.1 putative uncharacterized protein [Bacteroides sp. CAG:754]